MIEAIESEKIINGNGVLIEQLNEIASEIINRFDSKRQNKREPYDHSDMNWASEIGHPCKRFLVYARLNWKDRQLMDIDGEYRVEEGQRYEWELKKELGDIGFELNETQRTLLIPEFKIKGKIDGLLPIKAKLADYPDLRQAPSELKSISPNYWDSTRTIEDIKRHRAWWIRGYPSQLNVYIYASGSPFGFFILKTFGKRPRVLPMLFDGELIRADFAKIEDVNRHVEAKTYPEPIPYDPQICEMCGFSHLCLPLKTTDFSEIPNSEIPILNHFLELKDWNKQYEELKSILIGTKEKPGRYYGKNAIVGDIEILTTIQNRTFYEVPKDVKEPYGEKREIIITKIQRIGD